MAEVETGATNGATSATTPLSLDTKGLGAGIATAAVVGVGVALIEVAWVPGILLGVAAMAFPKLLPSVSRNVKPMLRSAIKTGYTASQKTREWVAEAGEQVSDLMAEVRSAALDPAPATADSIHAVPPEHVA